MATKKTHNFKSIAADYGWTVKALKELLAPIMAELEKMRGERNDGKKKKKHRIITPKMKDRIYEFLGQPEKN
jgi:hypothetical protein